MKTKSAARQNKINFLRSKIAGFQLEIYKLNRSLADQRTIFENRETEFVLNILEVLDAFELLDENIKDKSKTLDKSTLMLLNNILAIRNKILRFLKTRKIVPIEFTDQKAKMEYCKIVEIVQDLEKDNETILSVIKKGYINPETKKVIRKADVVTVKN
ncbi:MAG: nucleotide exchange factor GrpE [Elusimicrobiota bacterium]